MKKVSDIFLHKERKITAVSPTTTVLEALRIMSFQNIGSVMVMDNQNLPGNHDGTGLFPKGDLERKILHRYTGVRNHVERPAGCKPL